jgi:hypothetical protein
LEGLGQFLGDETEIKTLFVWVAGYSAESLGESLSVTMLASGADLGATAQGVPSRVCPFDFGVIAHIHGPAKRLNNVSIVAILLNSSKQKGTGMSWLHAQQSISKSE